MESVKSVSTPIATEQIQEANKTESAENFKKCIYELFNNSGVLNDLRAYLRGHIVNVLKSSPAVEGELPPCQKRFTQRLDPKFQALNMLIAEYLLCLEFSYSFSVFVAEIPLANMMFDFAKSLMDLGPDRDASGLRFKDSDVWSILNRLGVQCDSKQANNIVEMYKNNDELSLLFCIMKCVQLCALEPIYPACTRVESSSSCKTSEVESRPHGHHAPRNKCSHSTVCQTCRSHFSRLHEKYVKKKKQFSKNSKQNVDPLTVEAFMKKAEFLERKLMDETLDHVSSVYESEMNMVKSEQEECVKRSLASHAINFKEKQAELEESYAARSAALAGSLDHKKRFLWGLARALRDQHAHMARAMSAVRAHTQRLAQKEQNIKVQLSNAEETLKKRCEEMHKQITGEISNLEEHLESMKLEQDALHRQRAELDDLKKDSENGIGASDLRSHYDLLKEELIALKKYFENTLQKSRYFSERSTITELSGINSNITVMNNNVDRNVLKEEARPNQVVNNLKKTKNINFVQPPSSEPAGSCSRSSTCCDGSLARLLNDNERLRLLSEQQSAQLAEMSSHAARLQAALHRRPRTAPERSTNASASSNSLGWCKGAGEELCFSMGRPQILVPGDAVPFVGVVGERRAARCRHLMSQLRGARRPWPATRGSSNELTESHAISISSPPSTHCRADDASPTREVQVNLTTETESKKSREKSPNSVLREAKERLKTHCLSVARAQAPREASPSAMLREAKRRLRKLEIEAEAVEHSYRSFRRRRQRQDRDDDNPPQSDDEIEDVTHKQRAGHSKSVKECNDLLQVNLEKYLTKYHNEYDIGQTHFRNKNTVDEIKKPIPKEFSEHIGNKAKPPEQDYLNIPLTEFRNLYCPPPNGKLGPSSKEEPKEESDLINNSAQIKAENEKPTEMLKLNNNKQIKIKKQNISKIYNLEDVPTKEATDKHKEPKEDADDNNVLRVEVESPVRSEAYCMSEQSMTLTVESRLQPSDAEFGPLVGSASAVALPAIAVVVGRKQPDARETRSAEPTLTRQDVLKAIYGARAKLRARGLESGDESAGQDSFAADVDNYAAGDEDRVPYSPPKTSDDDVSWG